MIQIQITGDNFDVDKVKLLMDHAHDLKMREIQMQKSFNPNTKSVTLKEINEEAKRFEKYFKERMGLDKRSTHEPAFRIAFCTIACEYQDLPDVASEYSFQYNVIGTQASEMNWKIYQVYRDVMLPEMLSNLEKLMKPFIKEALDERDKWQQWTFAENMPVIKNWQEKYPDDFNAKALWDINERLKVYYKTIYLRSENEGTQKLGSIGTINTIAEMVADEVFGESAYERRGPASECAVLKEIGARVAKEQRQFEEKHILPILVVQEMYGLLSN